jgi:hypothetical protein
MPAFSADQLSDADLRNVISYLRSLGSGTPEVAAASATATPPTAPTAAVAAPVAPGNAASPTPLSQQVLSNITPGLSSYMLATSSSSAFVPRCMTWT